MVWPNPLTYWPTNLDSVGTQCIKSTASADFTTGTGDLKVQTKDPALPVTCDQIKYSRFPNTTTRLLFLWKVLNLRTWCWQVYLRIEIDSCIYQVTTAYPQDPMVCPECITKTSLCVLYSLGLWYSHINLLERCVHVSCCYIDEEQFIDKYLLHSEVNHSIRNTHVNSWPAGPYATPSSVHDPTVYFWDLCLVWRKPMK